MQGTKGKRPIVNPIKRREAFNRLIDIAMARKGIKRDGELAAMLGLCPSALSKRRSGKSPWQYDELCRLFVALEFEPLEVAEAMGVAA